MGPRTDCTVVVPWRDHPELLEGFQAAMMRGPMPEELVVVDDGSDPPVQEWYRGIGAGSLKVARMVQGRGYQAAVNAGVQHAEREIVVILNNDVEGGEFNWLEGLVQAVRDHNREWLTGPVELDALHAAPPGEDPIPYIDGWCVAGWRERLLELGPFTGRFAEPAYYADNDLCSRAGTLLAHMPAGLVHLRNVTAGPAGDDAVRRATSLNRALYFAGNPTRPEVVHCDGHG